MTFDKVQACQVRASLIGAAKRLPVLMLHGTHLLELRGCQKLATSQTRENTWNCPKIYVTLPKFILSYLIIAFLGFTWGTTLTTVEIANYGVNFE